MRPYAEFFLVYGTAFVGTELLLGALFAARAVTDSSRKLALLACAYAWSAPLAILNVLGLLGIHVAGESPQSVPAVWTLWHVGWPLFILAYAFVPERREPYAFRYPAVVLACSVGIGWTLYHWGAMLPQFVTSSGQFPPLITKLTIGSGIVLAGIGFVRLLRQPKDRDRWVTIGVGFFFLELCIAFTSAGRYSLQFFLARFASFLGAVAMLVAVIVDTLTEMRRVMLHAATLEIEVAHERKVADVLQRAALPPSLPQLPTVRLEAMYRPAHSDARIGGDWYDAFELSDGRLALTIGDVMGNGLEAAVTMNAVRQSIRGAAEVVTTPFAILDAVDRALAKSEPGKIVTAFIGILDVRTGSLAYASAGHPPAIVLRSGGRLIRLEGSGLPLGLRSLEPAANEKGRDVKLEADDVVFLYTDGLTEAGRDVIAGESQLCDLLARTSAATSVEDIYDRAIALTSAGTASDDVAILMARMLSVRDESEAELSGFVTTTKAAKA